MKTHPTRFAAAEPPSIDAEDDAFETIGSLEDLAGEELEVEDWSLQEDVRRLLEDR